MSAISAPTAVPRPESTSVQRSHHSSQAPFEQAWNPPAHTVACLIRVHRRDLFIACRAALSVSPGPVLLYLRVPMYPAWQTTTHSSLDYQLTFLLFLFLLLLLLLLPLLHAITFHPSSSEYVFLRLPFLPVKHLHTTFVCNLIFFVLDFTSILALSAS